MKTYAEILTEDNCVIKKRIKNLKRDITLKYKINGEEKEIIYLFDREKLMIRKKFIGTERVIFYKEGVPEPLDFNFKNKTIDMHEINEILQSRLFKALFDSVKTKGIENIIPLVLGLAGIGALVLIVLLG